jgi:hypothetical protein
MKVITLIAAVAILSGCASSSPKVTARQYCYTAQEIVKKDNEVISSRTVVKCNDDPLEQVVVKKAGLAKDCFENKTRMNLRGREVIEYSVACKKFDGTWEVMPHPTMHQ